MTPQTSLSGETPEGVGSLPMDGLGKSPLPKGTAPFKPIEADIPKASTNSTSTTPPVVKTQDFAIDSTGKTTPIAPVKIPNVAFTKPVTLTFANAPETKPTGPRILATTFVSNTDGDTGSFTDSNGKIIVCRIEGIDAPEVANPGKGKMKDQPFAQESASNFRRLVGMGDLILSVSKEADTSRPPDKNNNWGRALCKVQIQTKDKTISLSQEQAKAGLADLIVDHGTPDTWTDDFVDAVINKRGIHSIKDRQSAKDARKYGVK